MKLAIPRGIIYHSVFEDTKWLLKSLFSKLDDKQVIFDFEKAFATLMDKPHCVAFPFARTAIYFSLKQQNFEKGSEILMPPITIKGILDVVLELGLKPVFVDLNPETLCFDPDALRAAITPNTKAVLITYLFGIVPDVEALISIAYTHGLFVIEDFSQCLNGEFNRKKVGTFGHVGIYSASSIKTLDTYGGGLLVCEDEAIYQAMLDYQATLSKPVRSILIHKVITDLIRNLATTRLLFSLVVIHLLKLINRLSPESLVKQTGDRQKSMIQKMPEEWFSAYTSLQAEVGLSIIPRLAIQDKQRIENVEKLKMAISPEVIEFPKGVMGAKNVYWQLIGYVVSGSNIQRKIQSYGVDTARSSLLQISDLKEYPYQAETPNATRLYTKGYFVPSYPGLNDADLARVVNAFNSLKS